MAFTMILANVLFFMPRQKGNWYDKERITYAKMKEIILSCPDKRTQALLAFQFASGGRAGELAYEYSHKEATGLYPRPAFESEGAKISSFSAGLDFVSWFVPNFKNHKTQRRKVELFLEEDWLYEIVKAWVVFRGGETFLFDIKRSRIKGLIDAELKRYNMAWSSHDIRHCRATWIAEKTGNPYLVKESLGHARLETSTSYVSVNRDLMRQKLFGTLPPTKQ